MILHYWRSSVDTLSMFEKGHNKAFIGYCTTADDKFSSLYCSVSGLRLSYSINIGKVEGYVITALISLITLHVP